MSYDIRICCKVQDLEKYVVVATPEYDSPTYNLSDIFSKSMDWDYSQSKQNNEGEWETCYYRCDDVYEYVCRGIKELRLNKESYRCLEPENGWGKVESAMVALSSLRECIETTVEDLEIPLEHLYMRW